MERHEPLITLGGDWPHTDRGMVSLLFCHGAVGLLFQSRRCKSKYAEFSRAQARIYVFIATRMAKRPDRIMNQP